MSDLSYFNDLEIEKVKETIVENYFDNIKLLIAFSPILSIIIPFIPSKHGNSLIDTYGYFEAYFYSLTLFPIVMLLIYALYKYQSYDKFNELRRFLRKKEVTATIVEKKEAFFPFFKDQIIFRIGKDVAILRVDKDIFQKHQINEKYKLIIEEHTLTIFNFP
jgi:hypothetical protein